MPWQVSSIAYVQQLQKKFNEVNAALARKDAECEELIRAAVETGKVHAIQQSAEWTARLIEKDKEIQTLRAHVNDLYEVQLRLQTDSLQKDIQLNFQLNQRGRERSTAGQSSSGLAHQSIIGSSEDPTEVDRLRSSNVIAPRPTSNSSHLNIGSELSGTVESLRQEVAELEEHAQQQSKALYRSLSIEASISHLLQEWLQELEPLEVRSPRPEVR